MEITILILLNTVLWSVPVAFGVGGYRFKLLTLSAASTALLITAAFYVSEASPLFFLYAFIAAFQLDNIRMTYRSAELQQGLLAPSAPITSLSDRFWYAVVYGLGTLQTWIIRFCIQQPLWRSADGSVRTASMFNDRHLSNTIRLLERERQTENPIYSALLAESRRRLLGVRSSRPR